MIVLMNGAQIKELNGSSSKEEEEKLGLQAKANLFELVKAANYMDINSLLMLSCTKIASMLKGKNLESIDKTLSPDIPYKHATK